MDETAIVALDDFTSTIALQAGDGGMARSHQLAGAGARGLAGLADLGMQSVVFAALAWLAVHARPDLFPRQAWPWALPVAFAEWHIIYLLLFESFTRGLTPGKALLGLRVTGVDGRRPTPARMVIRNVTRVIELVPGCYIGAYLRINSRGARQRLGDRYASTAVIYSKPLTEQLAMAETPESLYSTSEDGYLLQAWIERELRFDEESQVASATDLAEYLHDKYDASNADLPDPVTYLRDLYKAEKQHHQYQVPASTE